MGRRGSAGGSFVARSNGSCPNSKTTADLFEASLASLEMLDGVKRKPGNEFSGADYALRLACDPKVADNVRAMALRDRATRSQEAVRSSSSRA